MAATLLAAAVLLAVLLLAYAAPRAGLPWRGAATPLPAAQFAGGVPQPDGRLRVDFPASSTQHLLQFQSAQPLHGRFLGYRIDAMPETLRLLFGWQDGEGGWRWAPLPFPRGHTTVDLARLSPDWSGDAGAVAFLLLPAELLPAAAVPALQLHLHEVALETDARRPALAALLDEWRAYRPWSGRSINTAGFDLRQDRPAPLQGFVLLVLAAALAMLALAAARKSWRRPAATGAIVLLAAGWLILDLAQLRLAWQRSDHLVALHQAADGALAVEPRLAQALQRVAERPELARPGARLVVLAADPFLASWPVFALLPLDVAALPLDALGRLHAGALVLRLGDAGELGGGTLRTGTHLARVRTLDEEADLQLLELLADPEPLP